MDLYGIPKSVKRKLNKEAERQKNAQNAMLADLWRVQQGGYGNLPQPNHSIMQHPGHAIPQQSAFGFSQQPGYGVVQQPSYGVMQQPGYGIVQQPAYGIYPQQSHQNMSQPNLQQAFHHDTIGTNTHPLATHNITQQHNTANQYAPVGMQALPSSNFNIGVPSNGSCFTGTGYPTQPAVQTRDFRGNALSVPPMSHSSGSAFDRPHFNSGAPARLTDQYQSNVYRPPQSNSWPKQASPPFGQHSGKLRHSQGQNIAPANSYDLSSSMYDDRERASQGSHRHHTNYGQLNGVIEQRSALSGRSGDRHSTSEKLNSSTRSQPSSNLQDVFFEEPDHQRAAKRSRLDTTGSAEHVGLGYQPGARKNEASVFAGLTDNDERSATSFSKPSTDNDTGHLTRRLPQFGSSGFGTGGFTDRTQYKQPEMEFIPDDSDDGAADEDSPTADRFAKEPETNELPSWMYGSITDSRLGKDEVCTRQTRHGRNGEELAASRTNAEDLAHLKYTTADLQTTSKKRKEHSEMDAKDQRSDATRHDITSNRHAAQTGLPSLMSGAIANGSITRGATANSIRDSDRTSAFLSNLGTWYQKAVPDAMSAPQQPQISKQTTAFPGVSHSAVNKAVGPHESHQQAEDLSLDRPGQSKYDRRPRDHTSLTSEDSSDESQAPRIPGSRSTNARPKIAEETGALSQDEVGIPKEPEAHSSCFTTETSDAPEFACLFCPQMMFFDSTDAVYQHLKKEHAPQAKEVREIKQFLDHWNEVNCYELGWPLPANFFKSVAQAFRKRDSIADTIAHVKKFQLAMPEGVSATEKANNHGIAYTMLIHRLMFRDKNWQQTIIIPKIKKVWASFDPAWAEATWDPNEKIIPNAENMKTLCWPLQASVGTKGIDAHPNTSTKLSYRPKGWSKSLSVHHNFMVWVLLVTGRMTLTDFMRLARGTLETSHTCNLSTCSTLGHAVLESKGSNRDRSSCQGYKQDNDFCGDDHDHPAECRLYAARFSLADYLGVPQQLPQYKRTSNPSGIQGPNKDKVKCGHKLCDFETLDYIELRDHWVSKHSLTGILLQGNGHKIANNHLNPYRLLTPPDGKN